MKKNYINFFLDENFNTKPRITNTLLNKKHLKIRNEIDLFNNIYFKNNNFSLSQKIYHYLNDLKSLPKCPICSNNIEKYIDLNKGYRKTCSKKCASQMCIDTQVDKYGGTPLSKKEVQEKIKKTNKEKYGVENVFSSSVIQNKIKDTNKEKYGSEHPQQNKDIREKTKQTNLEKYGHISPSKNNKIKEKIKKTNKDKYGVENVFSSSVVQNKIKDTNKEKYGVEYPQQNKDIREKTKKTNLEKYNTDNVSKSKKIKEKIKDTNKEKYGTEHPQQNKDVREKTKQTNLKKYGYISPSKNNKIKEITKETNLEKYGVEYPQQNKDIREKRKEDFYHKFNRFHQMHLHINNYDDYLNLINNEDKKFIEKFINNNYFLIEEFSKYFNISYDHTNKIKKLLEINIPNKIEKTKTQKEIYDFIKSNYNKDVLFNDKSILKPLELDLFIKDKKIAIEYNGLMFHSFGISKYSMFNNSEFEKENKKNHLFKTEVSEVSNIKLFHIFENEWLDNNKQQIWKSMLLNSLNLSKIKIYARNCYIKEITNKDSKDFIENNHIQGFVYANTTLGLYTKNKITNVSNYRWNINNELNKLKNYNNHLYFISKDTLVSLMSFIKPRFNKNYEWELLRFCSLLNTNIIGAGSKILKYFENLKKPKSLISYGNRRWTNIHNNFYINNGFDFKEKSNINFYYFHETNINKVYNRVSLQKHKLEKYKKEDKYKIKYFDPDKTNDINLYTNGYRKIYDSGQLVFEKKYY